MKMSRATPNLSQTKSCNPGCHGQNHKNDQTKVKRIVHNNNFHQCVSFNVLINGLGNSAKLPHFSQALLYGSGSQFIIMDGIRTIRFHT